MSNWSNGLCSCFNDCTICLLSFFVPCYQVGKNAEAVGENCLLYGILYWFLIDLGLHWVVHCQVRGKIRQQKGIDGSAVSDCLYTFCCGECAIAQEALELQGSGGQSMSRE